MGRSSRSIWRLSFFLFCVALGAFLLSFHVPRRTAMADMLLPALLLVAGPNAIEAIEERKHRTDALMPLVAIVGCDGAGKSTVAAELLAWMRITGPVELCHLGKQTGNIGRRIAGWPLVGNRLDRAIVKKAGTAKSPRGPGLFTAMLIYAFSMRRVRRFRRMLHTRRNGITILADRYPQIEVPGPMDGLGLAKAVDGTFIPRFLARRERAHYERMTQYRPSLVIRLNVDLPTAIARKPDHRHASLKTKIEDVQRLTFGGAPIVDIDSTLPLDEVLKRAKLAISAVLAHA